MKQGDSLGGQVKLKMADLTMNSIYQKLQQQDQEAKECQQEQLQNKLQGYLSTECQMPLPKYQDGGVFTNYIQSQNQFSELVYKDAQRQQKTTMDKKKSQTRNDHLEFQSSLLSATISEENKTDEKESNELGPSKGRPNTQLATSLGKVHLTKRMQQEREMFLGLSQKPRAGSKTSKETINGGNSQLQMAWNTAGFLPQTISSSGQKNTVKDFEYLKFLNDTILKDDVLDKFMQKAGEIEQAAGPAAQSPKKKQNNMTPLERIQYEFKRNPHRFHTCTRFESFFQKQHQQSSAQKKGSRREDDSQSNSIVRQQQQQSQQHDHRSQERHKSCAQVFQPRSQSRSPRKPRNINQTQQSAQARIGVTSTSSKRQPVFAENKPRMSFAEARDTSKKSNAIQKVTAGSIHTSAKRKLSLFRSRKNSTEAIDNKTFASSSQVSQLSKPNTAAGVSRRRKQQESLGANEPIYYDLNDQKVQLVAEIKRTSEDLSASNNIIVDQKKTRDSR